MAGEAQPAPSWSDHSATEDVRRFVAPGRTRAPFFRYFRFNLPRLTKAVLLVLQATVGAAAVTVALSDHPPFAGAKIALGLVGALAAALVAVGLATRRRVWDFGSFVAVAALLAYVGGLFGDAPYVWNGAPVGLAATWNLMMLGAVGYLLINRAVNYGMLVVWPDDQGFTD